MKKEQLYGALFGVAIGDALGVPAEFQSRGFLQNNPVTDFIGYKSHNQPPATFSDDSSLTFCLAESLCNGYNLQDIAGKFIQWYDTAYWTAGNRVFDIGMTTNRAIGRLKNGTRPDLAGDFDEDSNGNGSLMRIMPLLFYIKDLDIHQRFELIKQVSSVTHGHIRSVIACFYYLEMALQLLNGKEKQAAYTETATIVQQFISGENIIPKEINLFSDLLKGDITQLSIDNISSSGYVMSTLKAAMWCFMRTANFEDAVLMAVNLGSDSDTTGAVTGGLAGLYYGYDNIREKWRADIRRRDDIADLCNRLYRSVCNK
ncbi:MAG: ADP-ribosylglycohydrolase family protein [Chitinophagaceae bacterium]